jgi:hypothetical protein
LVTQGLMPQHGENESTVMATAAHVIDPFVGERLTEPGTVEARKGVSLQEQLAQMLQGMGQMQAEMNALKAGKPQLVKGKTAAPKIEKAPKPPKPESTGAWHLDALNRVDKKTGEPFYTVDMPSVQVHGDVAIVKANKWAPVLMLIKGKRKPIYLRAEHLASLVEAAGLLAEFAKTNEDYLIRSMEKAEDGE